MVREVLIEGTKSGLGGLAGGVMGFALGNTVGGGSGKGVARAAGTVAGAAAGGAIEEGATRQKGLEITVKLDNGEDRIDSAGSGREIRRGRSDSGVATP